MSASLVCGYISLEITINSQVAFSYYFEKKKGKKKDRDC